MLQIMGLRRVGHNLATEQQQQIFPIRHGNVRGQVEVEGKISEGQQAHGL